DNPFAVGAEAHALDVTVVRLEGKKLLAGLRIPHLQHSGLVVRTTPCRDPPTIGAEADTPDGIVSEPKLPLAGGTVPTRHPVGISDTWIKADLINHASNPFAVGAEAKAVDETIVPLQGAFHLARIQVPHQHLSLALSEAARLPARCDNAFA